MQTKQTTALLSLQQSELEEWRKLIFELIESYRLQAATRPVIRVGGTNELKNVLWEPLPENRSGAPVILEKLRFIIDNVAELTHPRFFAFVPSPGNQVSSFADYLISELNIFAGSWLEASGPAIIEQLVIDWFQQLIGYTTQAGGLFLSVGSLANLTALVVARTHKLGDGWHNGVIYCSDQAHSSIKRALKIMGFHSRQLRVLESDKGFQIPVERLKQLIETDRKNALIPFCIVANAGTTNTGAVDPLQELAEVSTQENMWLHVDGSYGLPAMFVDLYSKQFEGIAKADSISFDPHKWLFQNYSCGALLVANKNTLYQAFATNSEYLRDAHTNIEEVNFWDFGPELTRPFRALKLWLSIVTFGFGEFKKAIQKGCRLAETMQQIISETPDWQIISEAKNGVCCFRYAPSNASEAERNELNSRIAIQMKTKGRSAILSTTLKGRTVLRVCTINPRTSEHDLQQAMDELKLSAKEVVLSSL